MPEILKDPNLLALIVTFPLIIIITKIFFDMVTKTGPSIEETIELVRKYEGK